MSEGDLGRLETAVVGSLPAEYRKFMMGQNGGAPVEEARFRLPDGSVHEVEWFFTIKFEGKGESLPHVAKSMSDFMPSCLLPVAQTAEGHSIVLGLADVARGRVFLVTDDARSRTDASAAEVLEDPGIVPVAATFSAFVEGLF